MTVNQWQNLIRQLIDLTQGATDIDVLYRMTRTKTLRIHQVFCGEDLSDTSKRVVIWSPVEDPEVSEKGIYWDRTLDLGGRIPPGWIDDEEVTP